MLKLAAVLLLVASAAQAQTVSLQPATGPATEMTADALRALPQAEATLTFGNPPAPHRFQGPLLWTVLTQSHLVDPAAHAGTVRETLQIRGSDHYTAVIAMGELSPEFEGKQAVLALTEDGKALAMPRAVIPGDHRGGRGVHDVVALTVTELPKAAKE